MRPIGVRKPQRASYLCIQITPKLNMYECKKTTLVIPVGHRLIRNVRYNRPTANYENEKNSYLINTVVLVSNRISATE